MTNKIMLKLSLLYALGLLLLGAAVAQDQQARLKNLPLAVQKTVEEQSKGAKIRGVSKEVENGKTQYELELTVNGHAKDMIIDPNGTILVVEDELTLDSLAPEVKAEVEKNINGAKLLRLESLTKDGTLTGYESQRLKSREKVNHRNGA